MEFHLVTGSKGGAGKTLLSLMMLTRCLEKQKEGEYTLIVDLNNMNVDFSRLLLKTGNGQPHSGGGFDIVLGCSESEQDGKHFGFYLVEGFAGKKFVVAQPRNPFETYNHEQFQNLIISLKKEAGDPSWLPKIFNKYDVSGGTISRVIIDTNYHFASLFPMNIGSIHEDFRMIDIKIWFLWVYAQVEALFPSQLPSIKNQINESRVVMRTSEAVENAFSSTPFRHVISAIAMLPLEIDSKKRQFEIDTFKKVLSDLGNFKNKFNKLVRGTQQKDEKYTDEDIVNVIDAVPSSNISFNGWVEALKIQYDLTTKEEKKQGKNIDTHLKFSAMITGCFSKGTRYKNVYPFATYDPILNSYTDKSSSGLNCGDYLDDLKKLDVYQQFKTMLNNSKDFQ